LDYLRRLRSDPNFAGKPEWYQAAGGVSRRLSQDRASRSNFDKKYNCQACADFIRETLDELGIPYQRVKVQNLARDFIYSDKNKVISTNGNHEAVRVKGTENNPDDYTVFDQQNPYGISQKNWVKDLFGDQPSTTYKIEYGDFE
jgi:hypothetical protein